MLLHSPRLSASVSESVVDAASASAARPNHLAPSPDSRRLRGPPDALRGCDGVRSSSMRGVSSSVSLSCVSCCGEGPRAGVCAGVCAWPAEEKASDPFYVRCPGRPGSGMVQAGARPASWDCPVPLRRCDTVTAAALRCTSAAAGDQSPGTFPFSRQDVCVPWRAQRAAPARKANPRKPWRTPARRRPSSDDDAPPGGARACLLLRPAVQFSVRMWHPRTQTDARGTCIGAPDARGGGCDAGGNAAGAASAVAVHSCLNASVFRAAQLSAPAPAESSPASRAGRRSSSTHR